MRARANLPGWIGWIGWIGWFGPWVRSRADLPGWIGWIGWFGPRVCASGHLLSWIGWIGWFGPWVCGFAGLDFVGVGWVGEPIKKNPAKKAFSWQGFFFDWIGLVGL